MRKKTDKQVRLMTIDEAEKVVREYFGDVKVRFSAFWSLGAMKITVEYDDFKFPRTVRNDLERLIPNCEVEAVRDFSKTAIFKVLEESYKYDRKMDVVHDGRLFQLSILEIVYAFLYGKDLSAVTDYGELFETI